MRTTLAIDDDVLAAARHLAISLMDSEYADSALLSSHCRVTDSYLLALARANKGLLATLDRKLATEVVTDGTSALLLI